MKYIIVTIIKVYYKLFPEDKRRICIHAESCSKYVLRIAIEKGFFKAVKAYIERAKSCNANYTIESSDEIIIKIKTQVGIILEEKEINPFLLKSLKSIY
jgi:putative component of membrane protein insertase Oxa1/YidC/SpoIIIJ protein YidD